MDYVGRHSIERLAHTSAIHRTRAGGHTIPKPTYAGRRVLEIGPDHGGRQDEREAGEGIHKEVWGVWG